MSASAPVRRTLLRVALSVAIAMLTAFGAHAQTWNETGDAGSTIAGAQTTIGIGALTSIHGSLASTSDVDLYCIKLPAVPPAGAPLIQLQCVAIGGPNVYLFDATGKGVFTNFNCQGGAKSILAPNVSLAAGTYYVAVSYDGVLPQSAGGSIWLPAVLGQRAPDGPGASGTLTGWTGVGNLQPINPYTINLTFMNYCDSVTPVIVPTWGALKIRYR